MCHGFGRLGVHIFCGISMHALPFGWLEGCRYYLDTNLYDSLGVCIIPGMLVSSCSALTSYDGGGNGGSCYSKVFLSTSVGWQFDL